MNNYRDYKVYLSYVDGSNLEKRIATGSTVLKLSEFKDLLPNMEFLLDYSIKERKLQDLRLTLKEDYEFQLNFLAKLRELPNVKPNMFVLFFKVNGKVFDDYKVSLFKSFKLNFKKMEEFSLNILTTDFSNEGIVDLEMINILKNSDLIKIKKETN